jgi:hypothetical protein
MKFKELCITLDEKETRVKHWLYCLRRAGLIPERERKLKNEFTDEETDYFVKIQQFLADGCESVPEAIRLMQATPSPEEALDAYRRSQKQIEQLQKKVSKQRQEIALLKDSSWWGKVKYFINNIFKRKVGDEREVT